MKCEQCKQSPPYRSLEGWFQVNRFRRSGSEILYFCCAKCVALYFNDILEPILTKAEVQGE